MSSGTMSVIFAIVHGIHILEIHKMHGARQVQNLVHIYSTTKSQEFGTLVLISYT